jgi:hypothetical protein
MPDDDSFDRTTNDDDSSDPSMDDLAASVHEPAPETLFVHENDPPRAVLEDAAGALRDDDPEIRETAVEGLAAFVERDRPRLGVRSRVVVHLGERIEEDDAARVRRAAVEAAGTVVESVVDDHGAYDSDADHAGEWPPAEWVRDAFERDSEALRGVVTERLPPVAPALPPRDAGVAARYLVVARRDYEAFPADVDRAALTALANRVDTDGLTTDQAHVLAAIADADGERLSALAIALGALADGGTSDADAIAGVTDRATSDGDALVEALLDRIATAPRPTGPFGQRVPSPQADAAHDVLVDLYETFPKLIGGGGPGRLPLYVGHDRDAVRAGAAAVLAAVVEHGDDAQAAVATRDDLRACLTCDDLPIAARLTLLAALADGDLLARTHSATRHS